MVGGREVRVEAAPGGVDVEPLDDETARVVLKLLGAEFDLAGFQPRIRCSRAEVGPAPEASGRPLAPDPFEMLVGAITAQQISLKAARAVLNRFIERFGVRASHAYAFPAREAVAAASPEDLTALGFSRGKARYVLELARSELDLHALSSLPTTRSRRSSRRLPGSASGRRTGSSPGTSRDLAPGPQATSPCGTRSPPSMVTAAC